MKIGLNNEERIHLIEQIGDLEETHCHHCEMVKEFPSNFCASHCVRKCEIGKQINQLGKKLEEGRQIETGFTLTKGKYIKLKLKDYEDGEIAKLYKLNRRKLIDLKVRWGIPGTVADIGLRLIE